MPVVIREYEPADSIEEITVLLNRAYAELAAMGLRYVATWQTPDMTAEIIQWGSCFVALDGIKIVGTAMLYPTVDHDECPYYAKQGVFHFGKFAVDPARRGEGIGRLLFDRIVAEAKSKGATEIACDTAEPATHLIGMYGRWGMRIVARQDWEITNYVSVVMAKPI